MLQSDERSLIGGARRSAARAAQSAPEFGSRLLNALALTLALLLTCSTVQAQSVPTAEQNLRAELLPGGGVGLGWDASAEDAESITGTTPGETYAYQVLALRGAEAGQGSNIGSLSPPQAPEAPRSTASTRTVDSAPSNLTAGSSSGSTTLGWNAPAEESGTVTGYRILRGVAGTPLTIIENSTGSILTTYTDKWANRPGMTYTYQVEAIRGEELSGGSNEASVTIPQSCTGTSFNVSPVHVAVTAVPVVVDSTTADYFVLFVRPDLESYLEVPISVTLGESGATTLPDRHEPLPAAHYRIEKYPVATPGDVDGDCTSDIDELNDMQTKNPLNRAPSIARRIGSVTIPDRETFEEFSYQSSIPSIDPHLEGLEFVKFSVYDQGADNAAVYFQNTDNYRTHYDFDRAVARVVQFPHSTLMRGAIVFHPNVRAPDGSRGVYRFDFAPRGSYSFTNVHYVYELLAASMPLLENNLSYYPGPLGLLLYQRERSRYDASRVSVLFDADILPEVDFFALNPGVGFGLLRVMSLDERPHPRDIVIYESLPNDLPRVAGIITTVPQTPLSHVNLRALQDHAPNAFIRDALEDATIDSLIDSYVQYTVTPDGYTIRAATKAEVDAHYAASRPASTQTPGRDLTVTAITALSKIEFGDWDAFGVKAANVAVLGTLGFAAGTVPDGFAAPFYFYDEFMKANELDAMVATMLADADFQASYATQEAKLKELRDAIKDGTTPAWMITALEKMHAEFPVGTSLRYRSSTNNEDLPGFSGAGLYDSKTQDPDETEEDGIDKSIKGVWASLWNFGAFVERDFYRIDHNATAMGVLVHPNYSDELANGVAVSYDPLNDRTGVYYVNTQVGEDLITNPEALSVPEQLLLLWDGRYEAIARSNQVKFNRLIMTDAQIAQLRGYLATIHSSFATLYAPATGERFAIEIEFKITSDNVLAIKQARPWVFRPPNDPAAFPDLSSVTRTIAEGTPGNIALGAPVAATDADGDALTYSLSGNHYRQFLVDRSSGQLFTNRPLDYESRSNYLVTLNVHDGWDIDGQPDTSNDDSIFVSIDLTNEEEAGTVTLSSATPLVSEQLTTTLTDPDGSIRDRSWKWERSTSGISWDTIGGATSERYTPAAADLDHYLRVTVEYTDGHGSGKTAAETSDHRTRARNSRPQFPEASASRSIAENSAPGSPVGVPVTATDNDNDPLTYTLTGATDRFSVDDNSGQFRVAPGAALDHETGPSHAVTVTAADPSNASDTVTVTITVDDVDEAPVLSGNGVVLYPQTRTGSVATYRAADPEREAITWTLWGPDGQSFSLTNGVLRFVTQPDYDAPGDLGGDNSYEVTVAAADPAFNEDSLDVTVLVIESGTGVGPGGGGGGGFPGGGSSGGGSSGGFPGGASSGGASSGGGSSGGFPGGASSGGDVVEQDDPVDRFVDDEGSTHEDAINGLAAAGITVGCGEGVFCPSQPVTRAQMATFLVRALELPEAGRDYFGDDEGSVHEDATNGLAAAGITVGCGEGVFCPSQPVTRAQMATFLVRALELPEAGRDYFGDDEGSVHEDAINGLAAAGVTVGCGEGVFCPSQPVTRAQMATFLVRALDL